MRLPEYDHLEKAFSSRSKPQEWLLSDLCSVDRLDGGAFIDGLKEGKSAVVFFYSAIPYYSFLTKEAALHLLPDFFRILAKDHSYLITVLPSFELAHGRGVLMELTADESAAILRLFAAQKVIDDFPPRHAMLSRLEAIVRDPSVGEWENPAVT